MARETGHGYVPPGKREDAARQAAADKKKVDEVYRELLARAPENKVEPRIEPMARLLDMLGNPERAYPVIHVTGTNGKTSTARMIDALLGAHELRVGRFTSPHLSSVTERISIDGEPIGADDFVRVYSEVKPFLELTDADLSAAGENKLTYFEVLAALAFAAFADAPVEVAVLEVGMGGLWDATNVADGQVDVVMPISYDHQQYLGDTLTLIAGEKAGIIKDAGSSPVLAAPPTVVVAAQPEEAAAVLNARIGAVGARGVHEGADYGLVRRDPAVGGQLLTLKGLSREFEDVFLPLHGAHQSVNAASALAAVDAFLTGGDRDLDPDVVAEGFAAVTSPGRLELVRSSPAVLVDAAHNPAGAAVLADALEEAFAFSRVVGVVGMLADKNAEEFLAAIEPVLDTVVVTRSSSPRSLDPADLAEIAIEIFGESRVIEVSTLDDALLRAVEEVDRGEDLGAGVVVTGSITTVADARILFGRGA
ncbi:bifunctional folylpolyglutamate synthase/dihydrofolate synthase [Spelaeicoccus albus]|uniref:tetrahydrofolate synthase n=1 Tax=Spelaeicoccus albus TaxID=1280376 RepID=A0A7Z0IJ07_9MICO|nr:folylpolyglutamate synthase/dihydrofolate synthase family protein [Spelaeicoccus albus]NYI68917.1 dihydrofolate synthase/folylpolyglutamate synthase [Spelaeicoccus albus]